MRKSTLKLIIAIVFMIALNNHSIAQDHKASYELFIEHDGFSSFDGVDYLSVYASFNNNTNDTLYYQGARCDNAMFTLKPNSHFRLADVSNNTKYIRMSLPPHRAQKIQLFLTTDKTPDQSVSLIFTMNLYRWSKDKKIRQKKDRLPGKLTDNITLHYKANQEYWSDEDFRILDNKRKSILPDKDFYLLTNDDRKKYTLIVDANKISAPRDTIVHAGKNYEQKKAKAITVPAIIYNNSSDTLRFFSMSCSWYDFWDTDHIDIGIYPWDCDKNILIIITIPPRKNYRFILPMIYYSNLKRGDKYRVGISLQMASDNKYLMQEMSANEDVRFNKIWSNEIAIQ